MLHTQHVSLQALLAPHNGPDGSGSLCRQVTSHRRRNKEETEREVSKEDRTSRGSGESRLGGRERESMGEVEDRETRRENTAL